MVKFLLPCSSKLAKYPSTNPSTNPRKYINKSAQIHQTFSTALCTAPHFCARRAFPSCDPEACLVIEQFFRLFLSVYSRVFHRIEGVGGLHTLPIEWNHMFLLKVWICFSQYVSKEVFFWIKPFRFVNWDRRVLSECVGIRKFHELIRSRFASRAEPRARTTIIIYQ